MKAILVIDMPKACWSDCPCEYDMIRCQALDRNLEYVTADELRPDWCPLRPLPERKEEMDYLASGYNKCLDDILEGE